MVPLFELIYGEGKEPTALELMLFIFLIVIIIFGLVTLA